RAPAASVPATARRTGAPAVSAARTAKPSTAVLAKGGTSSGDSSGTEVTLPSTSPRGRAFGWRRGTEESTRSRASDSGITGTLCCMAPAPVTVTWTAWDGGGFERLELRFENRGWTADAVVARADVQYVVRLDEDWHVTQFLLF